MTTTTGSENRPRNGGPSAPSATGSSATQGKHDSTVATKPEAAASLRNENPLGIDNLTAALIVQRRLVSAAIDEYGKTNNPEVLIGAVRNKHVPTVFAYRIYLMLPLSESLPVPDSPELRRAARDALCRNLWRLTDAENYILISSDPDMGNSERSLISEKLRETERRDALEHSRRPKGDEPLDYMFSGLIDHLMR